MSVLVVAAFGVAFAGVPIMLRRTVAFGGFARFFALAFMALVGFLAFALMAVGSLLVSLHRVPFRGESRPPGPTYYRISQLDSALIGRRLSAPPARFRLMDDAKFVPDDFEVPVGFDGPGFRLEPLAPIHNERDHEAWMGSIDHIRQTPGMAGLSWPKTMTLAENMEDMKMHHREFEQRKSFTYSVLDGDAVIGCVYVYPSRDDGVDADVKSWVTEDRVDMDPVVWSSLSAWLTSEWPFQTILYEPRDPASEG